LSENVASNRK